MFVTYDVTSWTQRTHVSNCLQHPALAGRLTSHAYSETWLEASRLVAHLHRWCPPVMKIRRYSKTTGHWQLGKMQVTKPIGIGTVLRYMNILVSGIFWHPHTFVSWNVMKWLPGALSSREKLLSPLSQARVLQRPWLIIIFPTRLSEGTPFHRLFDHHYPHQKLA